MQLSVVQRVLHCDGRRGDLTSRADELRDRAGARGCAVKLAMNPASSSRDKTLRFAGARPTSLSQDASAARARWTPGSAPIRRVAAACVPSARRTSPRPGTTTTPFGRRSPAGREPPASSPRLGAQKGASATSIPRTAVWCTRRFGLRPLRGTRHKKTRPWFPTHSRISWPAAPHPYPHLAAGFPERGLVAVSPTCGGRPRRADCRHPPRGPNATLCRAHLLRGDRRATDVAMALVCRSRFSVCAPGVRGRQRVRATAPRT